MQLTKNKHLCLDCSLKFNYILVMGKISKNKCQYCKKSKWGTTLSNFIIRKKND